MCSFLTREPDLDNASVGSALYVKSNFKCRDWIPALFSGSKYRSVQKKKGDAS